MVEVFNIYIGQTAHCSWISQWLAFKTTVVKLKSGKDTTYVIISGKISTYVVIGGKLTAYILYEIDI